MGHTPQESVLICLSRPWACRRINHLSVWHIAIPSRRASLPLDCYQIILLGDRGTCVNNLPKVVTQKWNGRESNPQHPNHYSTRPHYTQHNTTLVGKNLRIFLGLSKTLYMKFKNFQGLRKLITLSRSWKMDIDQGFLSKCGHRVVNKKTIKLLHSSDE